MPIYLNDCCYCCCYLLRCFNATMRNGLIIFFLFVLRQHCCMLYAELRAVLLVGGAVLSLCKCIPFSFHNILSVRLQFKEVLLPRAACTAPANYWQKQNACCFYNVSLGFVVFHFERIIICQPLSSLLSLIPSDFCCSRIIFI